MLEEVRVAGKTKVPEAMPKFSDCYVICGIFATVTVMRGTLWVP